MVPAEFDILAKAWRVVIEQPFLETQRRPSACTTSELNGPWPRLIPIPPRLSKTLQDLPRLVSCANCAAASTDMPVNQGSAVSFT